MTRSCRPAVSAVLTALATLIPAVRASAEPSWCNPRRGAIGAVVGSANDRLGGAMLGGGRVVSQAFATGNAFGPTPTPSSAFSECISPRLGDEPRPDDPPPGGVIFPNGVPPPGDNSWIYGDPHLTTRDGLRYSFGGAGDYVLLTTEGVELQARFVRRALGSPASIPSAVALRVDGATVILMQDRDRDLRRRRAIINGQDVEFESGSWFSLPRGYVHRTGEFWRIEVPGVIAVGVPANRATIEVLIADALSAPTGGLLGDGDGIAANDLRTAEGALVDPRETNVLYGAFLDSWLRTGTASLFTDAYDAARDGPERPQEVRTLVDFESEDRDAASAQCLEAGITSAGPLLECAYDLLVVGDDELIRDHRAATLGTAGTLAPEIALGATGAPLATLEPGDRVRAGVPIGGAGVLEAGGAIDVFPLALPPGEGAFIRPDAPCSASSLVRVALSTGPAATSGDTVATGLGCDVAIPVPAGTTTLSIFAAGGRAETYAFTVLAPANVDLGALPFDVPVTGRWPSPGSVFGELRGSVVSAQPDPSMSCRRDWSIVDGAGDVILRAPQCVRLDAVELRGPSPFTLRIESDSTDAPYGFTLERGDAPDLVVPETVTLAAGVAGEPVDAVFELAPRERVYVEAVPESPTGGRFNLLAPDGRLARQWFAGVDVFVEETEPGRWTLRFIPDSDNLGNVRARVYAVPEDARVDGMLGETSRLTIVAPGQQSSVFVSLRAGQRIYADRNREALQLGILRLQGPDGAVVAETLRSQQDLLARAAAAGVHALTWDAFQATTGSIVVGLYEVFDDTRVPIASGDVVTLEVTTPGQLAEATFDLVGTETARVSADVDPDVILELRGPDGARVRATIGSAPVIVAASDSGDGTYVLRLRGRDEGTGSARVVFD